MYIGLTSCKVLYTGFFTITSKVFILHPIHIYILVLHERIF